jgi:hypothetical protein
MSADAKRTENYVKTGSGGSQRAPAVAPDLGAESVPSGAAAENSGRAKLDGAVVEGEFRPI